MQPLCFKGLILTELGLYCKVIHQMRKCLQLGNIKLIRSHRNCRWITGRSCFSKHMFERLNLQNSVSNSCQSKNKIFFCHFDKIEIKHLVEVLTTFDIYRNRLMNLKNFPPKNYTTATFVPFCNMVHTDGLILRWVWVKLLKLA